MMRTLLLYTIFYFGRMGQAKGSKPTLLRPQAAFIVRKKMKKRWKDKQAMRA
jgi:hypothetical protein